MRRSLEDTEVKSNKRALWTALIGGSLFGFLRGLRQFPKTGSYQFASVAIVFALGFSSNNIMSNLNGGNVENFYVESGVKAVAVLNPSDQMSRTAIFRRFLLMSLLCTTKGFLVPLTFARLCKFCRLLRHI